jgi:hypothetical protein
LGYGLEEYYYEFFSFLQGRCIQNWPFELLWIEGN